MSETDAGIVIRGAHAIATSVTMADWLFVSYITPLAPGDEDYAHLARHAGERARACASTRAGPTRTIATSVYDYPLSARFDEVDTTVVFDDVFVPWEHVFVYRNVELVDRAVPRVARRTSTANFQSLVRFGVKLEFMAGLARKLAEMQAQRRRRRRPGDARRRHRRALRGLRRARQGRRALSAGQPTATRARTRSTSTRA